MLIFLLDISCFGLKIFDYHCIMHACFSFKLFSLIVFVYNVLQLLLCFANRPNNQFRYYKNELYRRTRVSAHDLLGPVI